MNFGERAEFLLLTFRHDGVEVRSYDGNISLYVASSAHFVMWALALSNTFIGNFFKLLSESEVKGPTQLSRDSLKRDSANSHDSAQHLCFDQLIHSTAFDPILIQSCQKVPATSACFALTAFSDSQY